MVHPSNPLAGRPHVSGEGEPLSGSPLRSLDDRLTFRRAQAVLAGLTGCRQVDAAASLRATAALLDRPLPAVARGFLQALETPAGDEESVALLLVLAGNAFAPPPPQGSPASERPPAASTSRTEGQLVVDLSELTSLDPAALRALSAAAREAADADAQLTVLPPVAVGTRRLLLFAVRMRWLPAAFGEGSAVTTTALPAELEDLFDRHARSCLALARRVLGDVDRAEAVVEAVFVDAWRYLGAERPLPGPATGWLSQRTHEHAVARLRTDRTGPATAPVDSAPADRLTPLPVAQARALRWTVWSGCTVEDIAALTGTPSAEVRADLLAGVRAVVRAHRDRPADGQGRALHP